MTTPTRTGPRLNELQHSLASFGFLPPSESSPALTINGAEAHGKKGLRLSGLRGRAPPPPNQETLSRSLVIHQPFFLMSLPRISEVSTIWPSFSPRRWGRKPRITPSPENNTAMVRNGRDRASRRALPGRLVMCAPAPPNVE